MARPLVEMCAAAALAGLSAARHSQSSAELCALALERGKLLAALLEADEEAPRRAAPPPLPLPGTSADAPSQKRKG